MNSCLCCENMQDFWACLVVEVLPMLIPPTLHGHQMVPISQLATSPLSIFKRDPLHLLSQLGSFLILRLENVTSYQWKMYHPWFLWGLSLCIRIMMDLINPLHSLFLLGGLSQPQSILVTPIRGSKSSYGQLIKTLCLYVFTLLQIVDFQLFHPLNLGHFLKELTSMPWEIFRTRCWGNVIVSIVVIIGP